MPVSLVAIKTLRYEGRQYAPGQTFDARDASDAMVLKLARLAKDAPVAPVQPVVTADAPTPEPDVPRSYRRADLSADAKTPRRRTYRTDLTAEE